MRDSNNDSWDMAVKAWGENGPAYQVAFHDSRGGVVESYAYDFKSLAPGIWSVVTHSHGRYINEIMPAFRFLFISDHTPCPDPAGAPGYDAVAFLEGGSKIDIASRHSCFTTDGQFLTGRALIRGSEVRVAIPTPSLVVVAAADVGGTDDFTPVVIPAGPLGYELWPELRHNAPGR